MVAKFSRSRTVSSTTATGGSEKAPRIDQLVDMLQPKEKVWYQLRLVGPMFSYGFHWIEIESKKGKGGVAKFTKQCLAYSDEAESLDSTVECPYCDLLGKQPAVHYYQNVIVRKRQESAPKNASGPTKEEAKTGFKDMDSDAWTPVQVLRLPTGAVSTLRSLSQLNMHGKKGAKTAHDLSDSEFGCDVMYMFDNSKQGSAKHAFQKGEHTPLDEDEEEFLLYNIEDIVEPEDEKAAAKECERLDGKIIEEEKEEGYKDRKRGKGHAHDDDDEDEAPPKRKKPAVDDDDEDEPKPKRRKPAVDEDDEPPARRKKPAVDDDDDDEYTPEVDDKVTVTVTDEDEVVTGTVTAISATRITIEDEDEEEHKFKLSDVTVEKAKAKPKAKPKAKAKPVDDDEDEDEPKPKRRKPVADEDDEETPPPKKRKPAVDDDEDDEPPPKKRKPAVDEDDEDEPKPKRRKPAVDDDDEDEAPPKKRKPPVDEDDDDEEEAPKPKKRKPGWDD